MRGWDMTGTSAKWQLLCPIRYGKKIDPTLWNMAFTGQAKSRRCKFCFSLTHPSEDYDWAPSPPQPNSLPHLASVVRNGNGFVIRGTTALTPSVHTEIVNTSTYAFIVRKIHRPPTETTRPCTAVAATHP